MNRKRNTITLGTNADPHGLEVRHGNHARLSVQPHETSQPVAMWLHPLRQTSFLSALDGDAVTVNSRLVQHSCIANQVGAS